MLTKEVNFKVQPHYPIRILELRSVRGTGGGPEKTILLGAAQSNPEKYQVTVCYIRDQRDKTFGLSSKMIGLSIEYLEVIEKNSFDFRIISKLHKIVRDKNIDIIHAHDYKTNFFTALLAKTDKIIPLSTAHGWTGHTRREKFYYWADKIILKRFPKIIAVSSQIHKEFLCKGIDDNVVEVILNGIDPNAFKRDKNQCIVAKKTLRLPLGKTIIGSVGRLEPQKNYGLLLEVFAELLKDNNNIFLIIAGDGSLKTHLESKVRQLNIEGNCRLLGHQADISLIHHALDVYIQSSDYEGTANSVLEAMAFETPIIATDVGGTAELIRDSIDGIIIPPRDHSALRHAINKFLKDKKEFALLADSARKRVESDLSFSNRMKKLELIYDALMSGMC